jgi:hypothetical protein
MNFRRIIPGALDAAEPDAEETEEGDDETETFSPLDPEVEAPINAAVHLDDQ